MPFGEVKLIPGINVERTPTLLETGYSQSQFGRFKDGLFQKFGGWEKFYPFAVSGVPRDLHAWQDLNGTQWLLSGTTTQLGIISDDNLTDITPQQVISNAVCNFSTTANSTAIIITDTNVENVTVFDSINLLTPVAVGGLVLFGIYPIEVINGTSIFTIYSDIAASSSTSGGAVPTFTTTDGSPTVTVGLATHGLASADRVVFEVDTPASSGNDQYTKILLHMDGVDGTTSFPDVNAGGSAHTWTANGSAAITRSSFEFGGASGLFPSDGTSYITTADHADFTLGTSDFSVDFWFNCELANASSGFICGQSDSGATSTTISIYMAVSSSVLQGLAYVGTTALTVVSTTAFNNTQNTGWNYVEFTRNGTSLLLFVNGTMEGSTSIGAGEINDSSNAFSIGRLGEGDFTYWDGGIDEFRLSVGIARHTADFTPPTSPYANGLDIDGGYSVVTVPTDSTFTIIGNSEADDSSTYAMNNGFARIIYNIVLGPSAVGAGYGTGGYGEGGYGTGVVNSSQTGTPITASDWTSDNWGEIILACPSGGGVYQYNPTAGIQNASLVETAPIYNGGIFVSTTLQMLFCWGASIEQAIGTEQDPMLVSWSDVGDYTVFAPRTTNQAGSFRIPIGSVIRAGLPVANQNLFWTDLDLWAANYAGYPLVFGFNKIGAGAGAISSHAVQQLRNGVYWMNESNFYSYTGGGVQVIPCPIWDIVFQNLNLTYKQNVRAMPNTGFNEVGWLYPSTSSANGECDSYVKFNITEPGQPWDYGSIPRSAWIDQSILGTPIGATPTGIIFSQETTTDADGQPMSSSFSTGYFYIAEGEDFAFVDQIIPDMKWGYAGGSPNAQVYITVNAIDFPGDTPTTYGPYLMTSSTQYITTRIRARQMSFTVQSADTGSFWRLGKVRFRYSLAGRR